MRIAFIGLGVMGAPMARHLAAAGHALTVHNRSSGKADAWVAANGHSRAATPAEAADGAEVVVSCVGNDDDVAGVTTGPDGAFATMAAGTLYIDHSTVSAKLARRLAETADARGIGCVDAPVSGGQAGAEKGALSVMCGGDDADVARARPVMDAYSARVVHVGPAGAGQTTKMVNQIAIAGVLEGLAEGMAFTKAAGLDPAKVLEAISGGAAQSWQMVNRWETMAAGQFDFGFAVEWMRKDLGLALDEAAANGAELPIVRTVDGFYAEVEAMGGRRQDTSSLVRRYVK